MVDRLEGKKIELEIPGRHLSRNLEQAVKGASLSSEERSQLEKYIWNLTTQNWYLSVFTINRTW